MNNLKHIHILLFRSEICPIRSSGRASASFVKKNWDSMPLPPKFDICSSKIPICTLLRVSHLQLRKGKWRHVRKQWSWMCGECKRICDKTNLFNYKFRPNIVYIHEEIRSNYIRGMLPAFQFRTCAVYSTRTSKERSPKYKNNNFTVIYMMKYLATP
jgi:hypothetical protein